MDPARASMTALGAAYRATTILGSIYSMPEGVRLQIDRLAFAAFVLPSLLQLAACYLLFFPGRHWFAKRAAPS